MKKLLIIFGLVVAFGIKANAATATGGTITTNAGYKIHTFLINKLNFIVSGGTLNCAVLVVAVGGTGGKATDAGGCGGGGGAGGVIYVASTNISTGSYGVTVSGVSGEATLGSLPNLTATKGGNGGSGPATPGGGSGGSGGGGAHGLDGGGGIAGQGNNGGNGNWDGSQESGGGGGGAGAVGANAGVNYGGNGGNGAAYNISGSSVTYGGGGGGAVFSGTLGIGGSGGGGNAVTNNSSGDYGHGTDNTGGGGGGAGDGLNSGYGGSGIVIVRYLILPQQATTPSPANLAVNQATNLTLSWVNGGDATSYNVNFGISNSMAAKGNQAGTTYAPSGVIYNTNYQWRIDSVNAQGTTTGSVWSFGTTNPIPMIATTPSPTNNAANQSTNITLTWADGGSGVAAATNYQVYWGLNGVMTNNSYTASASKVLPMLAFGSNYQWRITSFNGNGSPNVITGTVWNFTVNAYALKAINPVPVNNYDGVNLSGTNLQWQDGGFDAAAATNFTLYFGLSGAMSEVYDGTDTNYATGALEKGKTYTWRVDSQNASASVTGDTWAFYSVFFVIAHKIMGVVDNVNVFGRKGNRVWGK